MAQTIFHGPKEVRAIEVRLYCVENRKDFPKLSSFASWPGVMINLQWLELPLSRTNFYGSKDVRAIEVDWSLSQKCLRYQESSTVYK